MLGADADPDRRAERPQRLLEFGYYWVTRFSLMLSLIGLGFGFLVWWVDRVGTGMLAMNVEQRNAHNYRSEIK